MDRLIASTPFRILLRFWRALRFPSCSSRTYGSKCKAGFGRRATCCSPLPVALAPFSPHAEKGNHGVRPIEMQPQASQAGSRNRPLRPALLFGLRWPQRLRSFFSPPPTSFARTSRSSRCCGSCLSLFGSRGGRRIRRHFRRFAGAAPFYAHLGIPAWTVLRGRPAPADSRARSPIVGLSLFGAGAGSFSRRGRFASGSNRSGRPRAPAHVRSLFLVHRGDSLAPGVLETQTSCARSRAPESGARLRRGRLSGYRHSPQRSRVLRLETGATASSQLLRHVSGPPARRRR